VPFIILIRRAVPPRLGPAVFEVAERSKLPTESPSSAAALGRLATQWLPFCWTEIDFFGWSGRRGRCWVNGVTGSLALPRGARLARETRHCACLTMHHNMSRYIRHSPNLSSLRFGFNCVDSPR